MDPWVWEWVDYYEELGVSSNASNRVIRVAYRAMAQDYHPDGGSHSDTERMTRINVAYDVLSDSLKKQRYDMAYRRRHQEPTETASPPPSPPPPSGPPSSTSSPSTPPVHYKIPRRSVAVIVGFFGLLGFILILSLMLPATTNEPNLGQQQTTSSQSSLSANNFGQPVPGQHIYDQAGVLSTEQINVLEQHARQVEAAGAPVVVYLQAKTATYSQTEQDARDLMDQWDVQSAPSAHDGLVFFFNLKPGDLHHGEAALFAGAKHYDGGNLPENELQRIFSKVMKPDLANGDLAQGIAAGLDAAENSLRNGPPHLAT